MNDTQLRFVHWIREREAARLNFELTGKKGMCNDPIIAMGRFCNVNREHDFVTKWVKKHVRAPLMDADINLAMFNLAITRVINEPATLRNFMPCTKLSKWTTTLRELVWYAREAGALGDKVLRGAYLIVSHGLAGKGIPAVEYYAGAFMDVAMIGFDECESMAEVATRLSGIMGFSDFLSNQVLTDLRYMNASRSFADRWTFVLPGPGTRRGINRYHGTRVDAAVRPEAGAAFIIGLRDDQEFLSHFDKSIIKHFRDPNNLSNCFCEWDKHERARESIAAGKKPSLHKF